MSLLKTLIPLVIIICTCTLTSAQVITPKLGLSISSISDNGKFAPPPLTLSGTRGYCFGVALNLFPGKIISVQPELLFHQKGYKMFDPDLINDALFNYVDLCLPVTMTFGRKPSDGKAPFASFFIKAGPFIARAVGGKLVNRDPYGQVNRLKVKYGPSDDSSNDPIHYVDHKLNLGVNLSAGITILKMFVFEVRAGKSLTNVYNDKDAGMKTRFNTLQFMVGVPLVLKKGS